MHSIPFASLDQLAAVSRKLGNPDVVAHQDEEGAWFLDVPDGLAAEAAALAAGPILPSKAELIAYAADRRRRIEVGGLIFRDVPIATDLNSQTKILGAYVAASRDPAWSTLWESVHPIDAATMIELGDAVQAHINRSFLKRAEVYAAIEVGTITSTAEVDAAFSA
ncbi:DUF4376 domain-containing protein [Bosea sp. TAF32]|uniref:DUF4376 domain-containing protein n=1 Tax=Bosea sp. TAF32 TaxID=3237482 RepID=UPI003F8F6AC9